MRRLLSLLAAAGAVTILVLAFQEDGSRNSAVRRSTDDFPSVSSEGESTLVSDSTSIDGAVRRTALAADRTASAATNEVPSWTLDPVALIAEEEAYKANFEGVDVIELRIERDNLESDFMDRTLPLFDELFAAGQVELAQPGEDAWSDLSTPFPMSAMRTRPDGVRMYVHLTPEQAPEAFELKKQMRWINDLIIAKEQ